MALACGRGCLRARRGALGRPITGVNRSTAMAIRRSSTTHALTALSAAALVVSACQKNDQAAVARNESAAGIAAQTDTTKRADTTTKPVASNGWTDESILAYLRAEDMDEVKVNELA